MNKELPELWEGSHVVDRWIQKLQCLPPGLTLLVGRAGETSRSDVSANGCEPESPDGQSMSWKTPIPRSLAVSATEPQPKLPSRPPEKK